MVRGVRSWCCAIILAAFGSVPATAANLFELNFWLEGPRYEGVLPTCDDQSALAKISSRFSQKEREFWNSGLAIVDFSHVRERAFRPWDRDLIPRRFCNARAHLSNGKWRPVHYLIGEAYGTIGATWGVEWCVVGYDRNWAYNPACKMAQP
jgi:hypothetical protein